MPFERILVAIDGSECSDHAFATALELAALANAAAAARAQGEQAGVEIGVDVAQGTLPSSSHAWRRRAATT
jgi:hypothetical protein